MSKFEDFFTPLDELRKAEPDYGIPGLVVENTGSTEVKRWDLESFLKKTPLSILEEGSKGVYQQTVRWQSKESPLTNNSIEFDMSCTLAGVTVSGKGTSKKLAKHRAAVNYLHEVVKKGRHKEFHIPGNTEEEAHASIDLLIEKSDKPTSTPTKDNACPSGTSETGGDGIPTAESIPSEFPDGNWIGKLQEFLDKNRLEHPSYEEEEKTASSKGFSVICKVNNQKTRGKATVKKAAKSISAFLMLKKLEKDVENMNSDLLMDADGEMDVNERERSQRIEREAFEEEDPEESLRSLLSDTHRFADYKMEFKPPTLSTLGLQQMFLIVNVTLVPPPEVDDLEVGAEHTQTEEIARVSATKDRERKRALDGGPFVFGGSGQDEEGAKKNACKSALINFQTYDFVG